MKLTLELAALTVEALGTGSRSRGRGEAAQVGTLDFCCSHSPGQGREGPGAGRAQQGRKWAETGGSWGSSRVVSERHHHRQRALDLAQGPALAHCPQ